MPKHCCCSVTQSCLTLWHGLQHARLPAPHHLPEFAQVHIYCTGDAISSSEALFSFCPQSFPASGTFPMSCLFASDYQNTAVSVSMKKEFTGPGLHLRPVCADRVWPPLQWTLNSVLSACGKDKGRIRRPLGRGILKKRKLITPASRQYLSKCNHRLTGY